jgi:quercetin dioxygenase-like cupin family protein
MPVFKNDENPGEQIEPGVTRKLVYLKNLMTAVLDFDNGPWSEPGKQHKHVHEQITYVVSGEIIFFCEGEPDQRLKTGDLFFVPSDKMHGIQLLSPTARLIDNFTPLREDFLK